MRTVIFLRFISHSLHFPLVMNVKRRFFLYTSKNEKNAQKQKVQKYIKQGFGLYFVALFGCFSLFVMYY